MSVIIADPRSETITVTDTAVDNQIQIDESELLSPDDELLCECIHGSNAYGPDGFQHVDDYSNDVGKIDPLPADFDPEELAWACGKPAVVMARGKYADCDEDCDEIHMFPVCQQCHERWLSHDAGTPWYPIH